MSKSTATKRISTLEAQVETLKRFFIGKPMSEIDEKNWQKVKRNTKSSRKSIYRKLYGEA